MRWKRSIGGLALLLALAAGCKQQCFMTQGDYNHYHTLRPLNLDHDTTVGSQPVIGLCGPPGTILTPDRDVRWISLAECVAVALEQGNVGGGSLFLQGFNFNGSPSSFGQPYQDIQAVFGGRVSTSISSPDSIRVLRLDPAIVGSQIESALSKFDAVFSSSLSYTGTDRPVGTSLDAFQSANTTNAIVQQDANFTTGLYKPLPTGGVAGITFNVDYTNTNLPARVNPSYRPSVQFAFEQPLLQGFGVEINQLRAAHPGAVLNNNLSRANQFLSPGVEGILITRIRFDQERIEFERNVQVMMANVEIAYWNLYYSYWNLYAQESGLRQTFETYKINKARFDAGRVSISDLAQSRGQYEQFRGQRLAALNGVLELERQLRGVLNLPPEDGKRLVPSDTPTVAPFVPDWEAAQQEALALAPGILLARQEVKATQLALIDQKNQLLPDLRAFATYDANAIGSRLDGADESNALRGLSSNQFNNYQLGVRLNVPIGFRQANANVRRFELQLARSYSVLQDQEMRTQRYLANAYRNIFASYEIIRAVRAEREAFAQQLTARFQEFLAGRGTLDVLLEAQRFWSDALRREYEAIRNYQIALVGWDAAKGTILQRNNVVISEGPLPGIAQKRAVEHLKERSDAIALRYRAQPTPLSPEVTGQAAANTLSATSVQEMWSANAPLKDVPELPKVDAAQGGPPAAAPLPLPAGRPQALPADPAPALPPARPMGLPAFPPGPPPAGDFGSERQPMP